MMDGIQKMESVIPLGPEPAAAKPLNINYSRQIWNFI